MHKSVREFVKQSCPPGFVQGCKVLEVGSRNVNGSIRQFIAPHADSYVGIDIEPGKGVDVVLDAADAPTLGRFDLVICCEMLEHAEDWKAALHGCKKATAMGGKLILTTRGPGFPFHEYPGDYWRFTPELLAEAMVGFVGLAAPDPQQAGAFYRGTRCQRAVAIPKAVEAELAPTE